MSPTGPCETNSYWSQVFRVFSHGILFLVQIQIQKCKHKYKHKQEDPLSNADDVLEKIPKNYSTLIPYSTGKHFHPATTTSTVSNRQVQTWEKQRNVIHSKI